MLKNLYWVYPKMYVGKGETKLLGRLMEVGQTGMRDGGNEYEAWVCYSSRPYFVLTKE